MQKNYILILTVLSVIAFSCKKNKDKSVSDMLQGKWYLSSELYNEHYSNLDHPDTTNYQKDEVTVEIKGNVAYSNWQGSLDTSTFTIIDGPKIVFNNKDTSTIKTITDTQLSFYDKEYSGYNPSNYRENTSNYIKY